MITEKVYLLDMGVLIPEGNEQFNDYANVYDKKFGYYDELQEYRYTDEESGDGFYYIIVPVKGPDAYWTVSFATFIENAVRLRPTIFRWAKSITFDN